VSRNDNCLRYRAEYSAGRAFLSLMSRPPLCRTTRFRGYSRSCVVSEIAERRSSSSVTVCEVFALANRVTVFRNGKRVLTEATANLSTDDPVHAMIGGELDVGHAPSVAEKTGMPLLRLRGFAVRRKFDPVRLDISRGEIVGITGQPGAGASSFVDALCGLEPGLVGDVAINGEVVQLKSLSDALIAGTGYVAEDRGAKSLFLGATVGTNLTSAVLGQVSRWGF
jgi:ribose transport system ATP-binding protein